MDRKRIIKPLRLDSKVMAELRESKLTISEFIKRYGMKKY